MGIRRKILIYLIFWFFDSLNNFQYTESLWISSYVRTSIFLKYSGKQDPDTPKTEVFSTG